jgi:hypothetical protein
MKILHYLDAIFIRLSVIPGLGFLHEYVEEIEIQVFRRRLLADRYRGYARSLREAGDAAKHGGHGHDDHGGHGEHEGHKKGGKRGGAGSHPAHSSSKGQAARPSHEKEDVESDDDYYEDEDDDFESYLQH